MLVFSCGLLLLAPFLDLSIPGICQELLHLENRTNDWVLVAFSGNYPEESAFTFTFFVVFSKQAFMVQKRFLYRCQQFSYLCIRSIENSVKEFRNRLEMCLLEIWTVREPPKSLSLKSLLL